MDQNVIAQLSCGLYVFMFRKCLRVKLCGVVSMTTPQPERTLSFWLNYLRESASLNVKMQVSAEHPRFLLRLLEPLLHVDIPATTEV